MDRTPLPRTWRSSARWAALVPLVGALAYPYLLMAFHWAIGREASDPISGLVAIVALAMALAAPVTGVATLIRIGRLSHPTAFELRARHLSLLAVAAPPLFVFFGVGLGLIGSPVRDTTLWPVFWIAAYIYGVAARDELSQPREQKVTQWRVAHGAIAAVLLLYIVFHLGNHLTGLLGPAVHARVMEAGRMVYRSRAVEPVLITLLIGQILIGVRLARRWCESTMDVHRALQVASGAYVGAFVLTHLNSALVSARAVRGISTDWAWASGAPEGLVADAWNIRLLPHYGLGVLFVLVHLCAGLRVVLLAHGTSVRVADRLALIGMAGSAAVAATIVAALCGVRV